MVVQSQSTSSVAPRGGPGAGCFSCSEPAGCGVGASSRDPGGKCGVGAVLAGAGLCPPISGLDCVKLFLSQKFKRREIWNLNFADSVK